MKQKIRIVGYFSPVVLILGLGVYYINGLWDFISVGLTSLGVLGLAVYSVVCFDDFRQVFSLRGFRSGTNTLLLTGMVLSLVVVVNVIGYRNYTWKDITFAKKFELSPLTNNILDEVKQKQKDINITAFFWQRMDYNLSKEQIQDQILQNQRREEKLRDLLAVYGSVSPYIHYRFIDPNRELMLSRQYNLQRFSDNVVAVESGSLQEMVVNMSTEEQVTNALIKVLSGEKRAVYFLEGHGERAVDDGSNNGYMLAASAIRDQNYEVKPLNVLEAGGVPADCRTLVISGPAKPVLPEEVRLIDDYLENGGRVMVLLDPENDSSLEDWLLGWGVRVDKDLVVDNSAAGVRQGAGPEEPLLYSYDPRHPITSQLKKAYSTMPTARSVRLVEPAPEGLELTVLARTSDNSWGETDLTPITVKTPTFDPADISGPVPVAVSMLKKLQERSPGMQEVFTGPVTSQPTQEEIKKIMLEKSQRRAEMVVFGDSQFASNGYFRYGGNWDLFMNSVNWLVGDERLISIKPRDPEDQTIYVNQRQTKRMALIVQFILPSCVLLFGVWVWVMRTRY
jgi:ABC-type uncharacterized transport system involved in gliding motility auxiliary subunit